MRLQILHVPDCPGAQVLRTRLAAPMAVLVAAQPGIEVGWQVVTTENTAARLGMTGSPTILADGRDLFPVPGLNPSLSCRLYPDDTGRPGRAPTTAQLERALRLAGD